MTGSLFFIIDIDKGVIVLNTAETRNQRIIDAVLQKEKALCPGAIALIGIYGSFQTGDVHPLSDLDLLILINDDRAWQLGAAFIQEDLGVGHDIYCTDWESLRRDAAYEDPNIAKLMDARIVYCADEKYLSELEALRGQVRQKLAEPFSEADYLKAEGILNDALHCFALAMIGDDLTEVRKQAGGVLYFAENAVAMLNKRYFRKGVRRRYEELNDMTKRPERLCEMIEGILSAGTVPVLKERLTLLVKELTACFAHERQTVLPEKKPADAETLRGTYEEMFSNWHGKLQAAAETGDCHLAFMSLVSLDEMLSGIRSEVDIGPLDAVSVYDPEDLDHTAMGFDAVLRDYLREYNRAGMRAAVYPNIDAFLAAYLQQPGFETEQLLLRLVTEGDLAEVARTWPADHHPLSDAEAREAIASMRGNYQRNVKGRIRHLCLAVCGKEHPGTIMGWCGLDGRRDPAEPEIFILLDAAYRNQGYGTQCVRELLRIAVEEYALKSVHGGCAKANIASARAMEKGGMVRYGTEENGDPLFRFTAKEKSRQ